MEREIIFRGKRVDTGEWAYGYLFKIWERCFMLWGTTNDIPNMVEVIPETVGQFTNEYTRLGQQGQEIYEGDRVEVNIMGINYGSYKMTGIVVMEDGCWTVKFSEPVYDITIQTYRRSLYVKCFVVNHAIKVIGTIHDNLGLLKEATNG